MGILARHWRALALRGLVAVPLALMAFPARRTTPKRRAGWRGRW